MALVPFSEEKARDLSEGSEQTGCKGTAHAFLSHEPPLRNTTSRFSFFSSPWLRSCYQCCRECVFILGSQQWLLRLIQKRKWGLSSLCFPNCSFSETSLRLKLGAHFYPGMKSSGRCHQILAMARAQVSSSLPGPGSVPFQGRTSQGHISGLFSVK